LKISIYGISFGENFNHSICSLLKQLQKNKVEVFLYADFYAFLKKQLECQLPEYKVFKSHEDLDVDTNFMFSIGGDGTFLQAISFVGKRNIPIVGINTGRLGFLAYISQNEIQEAISSIISGNYTLEERTLIQLESSSKMFADFNYALNEVTIHKKDSSSMITIHTYLNGEFLNTYWADGLIISTPTGSTAYSLSVGGPIVIPNSQNFILTPIAPHKLTERPIILSDNNELTLKVEGRSANFLASLDYRSDFFDSNVELKIRRADFTIKLIQLRGHSFFKTLRNKLMWGVDKRN